MISPKNSEVLHICHTIKVYFYMNVTCLAKKFADGTKFHPMLQTQIIQRIDTGLRSNLNVVEGYWVNNMKMFTHLSGRTLLPKDKYLTKSVPGECV